MNRKYFDDYMDMRNMNNSFVCPFMGMNQGMYPCEMMNMTAPSPCMMENITPMNQPKCMYNMMQPYAPMYTNPMMQQYPMMQGNPMMQQNPMTQENPMGSQEETMPYRSINPYELRIKTVNIEDVTD
ncbi:MAG: hypothetical protein K0R54_4640 [Clostridiaceae bacterium]|jgi:hypothetical protein|nr:hypothetical protein [Clostridiaceae bacterium]